MSHGIACPQEKQATWLHPRTILSRNVAKIFLIFIRFERDSEEQSLQSPTCLFQKPAQWRELQRGVLSPAETWKLNFKPIMLVCLTVP